METSPSLSTSQFTSQQLADLISSKLNPEKSFTALQVIKILDIISESDKDEFPAVTDVEYYGELLSFDLQDLIELNSKLLTILCVGGSTAALVSVKEQMKRCQILFAVRIGNPEYNRGYCGVVQADCMEDFFLIHMNRIHLNASFELADRRHKTLLRNITSHSHLDASVKRFVRSHIETICGGVPPP